MANRTPYPLPRPNENTESKRLNMQHFILKAAFGGNHISDINLSHDSKVLEIGYGTGVWLIEMANEFPNTYFTGIDISTIVPENVPSNVQFIAANAIELFPFTDEYFDFVHIRNMIFAFTPQEWTHVLGEIHRVLKKGGYIQTGEAEASFGTAGDCITFTEKFQNTLTARGKDPYIATRFPSYLSAAGFTQLKSDFRSIPFGWGNSIGEALLDDALITARSLRPTLAPAFEMTLEEYDDLIERVKHTCIREKQYQNWWRVWGLKDLKIEEGGKKVQVEMLAGDGSTPMYGWMPETTEVKKL